MRKLFVLLYFGVTLSCNIKNLNCDSLRIGVHLIKSNSIADVWCDGHLKKGDTVIMKRVIDQNLKNMLWYHPEWEIDLTAPFKNDTAINDLAEHKITYYAKGVVQYDK